MGAGTMPCLCTKHPQQYQQPSSFAATLLKIQMSVSTETQEILKYLESKNPSVVKEFKNIVNEKLYASQDNTLLNILTDRYIQTKSSHLVDLLVGVNDTHANFLFERLNEHLKHGSAQMEVCSLLFSMVQKQPSWLHKLVQTSLFVTFLKYLKNDNDIIFIMGGIIFLCSLLPAVPAMISPHLGDVLEVFVKTAGILVNKTDSIPEICLLHLRIGLYIFFHRLYTMYPNNFMSYMRSYYGEQKKEPVFQTVVKPMFEFVKFHPDLITETRKSETRLEKWKVSQPHDVLFECTKLSLDPIDAMTGPGFFVDARDENRLSREFTSHPMINQSDQSSAQTTPQKEDKQNNEKESMVNDKAALCNPLEVCALATPPSSRTISPSSSGHELHSILANSKAFNNFETDSVTSSHTLNEINFDRKSSGETSSFASRESPSLKQNLMKTKSVENVHPKPKLKMWSSFTNYSTPIDKDNMFTPINLNRNNSTKPQQRRPLSTDMFKIKKDLTKSLSIGVQDQHPIVQSAPVSPMVHSNAQFNFTPSPLVEDKARESHKPEKHNDHHIPLSDLPPSMALIQAIQEKFVELLPKHDPNEQGDTPKLARSPLNLLDDFIQYGADIHAYELSRIPLTSQVETNWTYFGGNAPQDELKIVQTQLQLLHVQILYERHKCDLQCLRNRRLFGKIKKFEGQQRELDLLRAQIKLYEEKLNEMKQTVQVKCEENKLIKLQASTREQEYFTKIFELEERKNFLECKLRKSGMKKTENTSIINQQKQDLQRLQHVLFESEQDLNSMHLKMKDLEECKEKVSCLTKELLKQSEQQQKVKDQVQDYEMKNNREVELESKLNAHRREVKELGEEKELLCNEVASAKVKYCELEASLAKKEKLIREHQESMTALKKKHKSEVKVLEDRFHCVQKTCQSLQSYTCSLFAKLEGSGVHVSSSKSHSVISLNTRKSSSYAGMDIHSAHKGEQMRSLPQSCDNPFTFSKAKNISPIEANALSSMGIKQTLMPDNCVYRRGESMKGESIQSLNIKPPPNSPTETLTGFIFDSKDK